MNAKSWLNRGRNIDKEINVLLKAKQEARDRLTHITQNYDGDGAQVSKDPHKYDRLMELESLIDNKVDEFYDVSKEITEVLMQIPNRNQRMVLVSYYVRMKTFEQIAVELDRTWRGVMYLRKAGIMEVERILNERGLNE